MVKQALLFWKQAYLLIPLYLRHGGRSESLVLSLSEEAVAGPRPLSPSAPRPLLALLTRRLHHSQKVKATVRVVDSASKNTRMITFTLSFQ
jgi:hypothetical protein